jgi:peptidoglycan/xylan/chitin deacetylase (PgdA/CDA1 family)
MLIPNKRDFLARGLAASGSLALVERFALRPCVLVFCYHRILERGENGYYHPIDSATPADFEAHVQFVRDRFDLPHPDSWAQILLEDAAVKRPTALITFDDGYRDNYERAYPILKKLGVGAMFFLATEFLETPKLPWWDFVAYVIKQTRLKQFVLEQPEPLTVDIGPEDAEQPSAPERNSHSNRSGALRTVISAFLRAERPDDPSLLGHLADRAEVTVADTELTQRLFVTWDEARAMQAGGMAIGSHTRSHRRLAHLPEHEQASELAESKQILESALSKEVVWLAYPYGDASAFSSATKRLASRVGYHGAFALTPPISRGTQIDPFAIPRITVSSVESATLFRARADFLAVFGRSML